MSKDSGERRLPNLARRLLTGAGWALLMRGLGTISGLIVAMILTRILDPSSVGAYFLLVSIVMIAAVVARFGLKQTIVKLVAESFALEAPGRARATLVIAAQTVALGILLVAGAYAVWIGDWLTGTAFAKPELSQSEIAAALWIALLAIQTPIAETFRGLHDVRLAVLYDGVLASLLLAAMLGLAVFISAAPSLDQVIAFAVASVAMSIAVGAVSLYRVRERFRGPGSISRAEVYTLSGPLFVTNLATVTMTNASIWIAAALFQADELALYATAWKLVNLAAVPLMLVNLSVQPVVAELYTKGRNDALEKGLRGLSTLSAIPAILVLLTFVVFGGEVMALVYGDYYRAAAGILAVLSVGHLVHVWTGSCGLVLAFTGHQKVQMQLTLAAGVLSVVAMILGGHYLGLIGVALGATSGRVVHNLAAWLIVRKLTGLWTHASFNRTFLRLAYRKARGLP